MLINPYPDQEGNKLQPQKILMFIYPIYNHNCRNISTIYTYITRLASNEIFSPSNKIDREVGRTKDLSAPRYGRAGRSTDDNITRRMRCTCRITKARIQTHIIFKSYCFSTATVVTRTRLCVMLHCLCCTPSYVSFK